MQILTLTRHVKRWDHRVVKVKSDIVNHALSKFQYVHSSNLDTLEANGNVRCFEKCIHSL